MAPRPSKTTDDDYEALLEQHLDRRPTKLRIQYVGKHPVVGARATAVVEGERRTASVRWRNPKPLVLSWSLPEEAETAAAMVNRVGFYAEDLWSGDEPFVGTVDESDGEILEVRTQDGSVLTAWEDIEPKNGHFTAGNFVQSGRRVHFEQGKPVGFFFQGFNADSWDDRFFEDLMEALIP